MGWGLGHCNKCEEDTVSVSCTCTPCLSHRHRCSGKIIPYAQGQEQSNSDTFVPVASPAFHVMTLVAAAVTPNTVASGPRVTSGKISTKDPFKPKGMRWKGKTWPYATCLNCQGENRLVIPGDACVRLVSGKQVLFFGGWCKACLNSISEEAAKIVSDMAGAQFGGEKV